MKNENNIAPINKDLNVEKYEEENIKNLIYTVRGKQVMLDSDVARLYHYETKYINLAVRRNIERFPENFCFQLTENELEDMWLQFATTSKIEKQKFRRKGYTPYAFTEQGIAMLSGLLKNENNIAPINKDLNVEKYEEENIKNLIYTIRGKQVMLDSDVARLYHYETKNVNKAMKRNIERFPEEFCFQLTYEELECLRFQIGTSKEIKRETNNIRGGRRYLPYAYTEQGIAMLAGILKNENNIAAMNKDLNVEKYEEENIKNLIYTIRGNQVMLDRDLAKLYNCKNGTKTINQAVKRNIERFPERFMFKLTETEYTNLRSQIGTAN